ncbi:MAG: PH domain-containing protein [Turicibacter sp.]
MNRKFKNHYFVLIKDIFKAVKSSIYFGFLAFLFDLKAVALLSILCLLLLGSITYMTLKWLLTTFEITEDSLIAYSGIVIKKQNKIPLNAIQTVDLKETFWQRLFKVNAINIDTGTMQDAAGINLLLTTEDAKILQNLTLQINEEVKDLKDELYKLKHSDLMLYCVTNSNIILMLGMFLSVSFLLGDSFSKISDYVVKLSPVYFFLVLIVIYIILKLLSMIKTFSSYKNYKMIKQDQMLKVTHGYFTKKSYSVHMDRICCVKIKQNYFQQLLNVGSVVVVAMGYGDSEDIEPTLIPLINMDEFADLFDMIFSEFKVSNPVAKPPQKAYFSYFIMPLIMLGILILLTIKIPLTIAITLYLIVMWLLINAHLKFKEASISFNDEIVEVCFGGFNRTKTFVKFNRIDSLTYTSNFFQRRKKLLSFKLVYESRGRVNKCKGLGFYQEIGQQVQDILKNY